MYQCSNKTCRANYNDEQADELKGNCAKCQQPLANEQGLGWKHVDSLKSKPDPKLKPSEKVEAKQVEKPGPKSVPSQQFDPTKTVINQPTEKKETA